MTQRREWERLEKTYRNENEDVRGARLPSLQQVLAAIIRNILATDFADRLSPTVSMGIIIHVQAPKDAENWDEDRPRLTFAVFHGGVMDVIYTSDGGDPEVDLRGIPMSDGIPKVMEYIVRLADETGA
jgi:hypothetical protein